MKKEKKKERGRSFRNKIHTVLGLLGIIPYLLTIYIFIQAGMNVTESILLIAAVALIFHLAGFQVLRTYSDKLLLFVESANQAVSKKTFEPLPVHDNSTIEMVNLTGHFNMLLNELEENKRQFNEVTVALMKQARKDIQNYRSSIAEGEARQHKLKAYVGDNVMEQVIQQGDDSSSMQGKRCQLTIMFADIRSFTAMSEKMEPEQVVTMLNEYFDAMVQIIHNHGGFLDKFIGDEVMAIFGLNNTPEAGAEGCIQAALEMQWITHRIMKRWAHEGRPTFKVGIGVNSGEAIIGNLGSKDRMNYTVIGDTVNVAARLTQHAGGGEILISGSTARLHRKGYAIAGKGSLKVKNREQPVECYKIKAKQPPAADTQEAAMPQTPEAASAPSLQADAHAQ